MENEKPRITVIVIGHVDSGKSTLVGHLIYKLGGIDKRTVEKLEMESKDIGRESFKYAFIVDKLRAERERGLTINNSIWKIETKKYDCTFINAPGHRDFIKNTISGLSQADIGILVVSSAIGEFEAGISKDGQTREHALLAYTLGIKQLIVVVNKMDHTSVNWSQARYEDIKHEISNNLKKTGYQPNKVTFIICSGWTGANILEPLKSICSWWNGLTLLEEIDALMEPKRLRDKPLRMAIADVYKIGGIGTVVVGQVLSGVINTGMTIRCAPYNVGPIKVNSIEIHHQNVSEARAGDYIGINVNISAKDIHKGYVCGNTMEDPPHAIESFIAQVIILNHPNQIHVGYSPVIDCHTTHVQCKFVEFVTKFKRDIIQQPKFLKSGDAALIKIVPLKPMCIETFANYSPLGRFSVRDISRCVAVGVVKEVNKIPYVDPVTDTNELYKKLIIVIFFTRGKRADRLQRVKKAILLVETKSECNKRKYYSGKKKKNI